MQPLDNFLEPEPLRLRRQFAVSTTCSSNELVESGFCRLSFASNALYVSAAGERAAVQLSHRLLCRCPELPLI
jgi:hypothetical protein